MVKKKSFGIEKIDSSMKTPKVFRAKDGRYVVIVYRDREETYDHSSTTTFKEITEQGKSESDPNPEPYTMKNAIDLSKGGGSMQEIHFSDLPETSNMECKCEKKGDSDDDYDWQNWHFCKCKIKDENGGVKILVYNLFVEKE